MKTEFLQISALLALAFAFCGPLKAQNPTSCASVSSRSNGNGQANLCPNVSGTLYATNFIGTPYATVPAAAKTGNIVLSYSGSNPLLTPYAVTRVWVTSSGTTLLGVSFGPAGIPTVSAGNTLVNYCYYGANLPTAGTLSLELTDPRTGVVYGMCSYDASCNGNCTVTANPFTLPVAYAAFSAVQQPNHEVLLQWTTAQEQNDHGFTVERSTGDSTFASIAFEASIAPNGNSSEPLHYNFTDAFLPANESILMYRLRQEDRDARYNYSAIQVVRLTPAKDALTVYTAGNKVRIDLSAGANAFPYEIVVYDSQGRVVRRLSVETRRCTVDGLRGGAIYFIAAKGKDGNILAATPIWLPS